LDSLAAFAAENQDFPVTSGDPKMLKSDLQMEMTSMEKAKKSLT
jgi:hypothetical protein